MDEAACKGAHIGWNCYLTTEPTTCIHNSKNFVYSQTTFHHVSVTATIIVREVYFCEQKHSCCKLPIILIMHTHTQIHFASPTTQGASQQAPWWWGPKVNLCVHRTDSLQLQCFGSQRWTSLTMAVSATETRWNIVWRNVKFFELLYMHIVDSVFRYELQRYEQYKQHCERWCMKMPPKFTRKVEPGGLLQIPKPHHQNEE